MHRLFGISRPGERIIAMSEKRLESPGLNYDKLLAVHDMNIEYFVFNCTWIEQVEIPISMHTRHFALKGEAISLNHDSKCLHYNLNKTFNPIRTPYHRRLSVRFQSQL